MSELKWAVIEISQLGDEYKIGYRTTSGVISTAYAYVYDSEVMMIAIGHNKHSDERVVARWDEAGEIWLEDESLITKVPENVWAAIG